MVQLAPSTAVLVIDDDSGVPAGLRALVDAEPGLTAVDAIGDPFAIGPAVFRGLRGEDVEQRVTSIIARLAARNRA